ncbi:MAG: helix-turn-helix domain-containing protein [Rhodospirillaceae bacterium]
MSGVQSLDVVERIVTVLRTLNAFDGVTVSELAKLSNVPRAAVNRYLVTLIELGFVARDNTSRKYTVTPKVLELSAGAPRNDWAATVVRPIIVEACKTMGWPLSFGTIHNSRLAVLENTDTESPLIVYPMREHLVLPLLGRSAGHVLLAHKTKEVRDDIIRSALLQDRNLLSRTPYDQDSLDDLLAQVVAQGYAATKLAGMNWSTLSVPVYVNGSVEYSLSNRFHPTAVTLSEAVVRFLAPLHACAATLGKNLERIYPL